MKIESLPTTTITYTTTAVSDLTLVFDSTFTGKIKLSVGTTSGTTTSYTAVAGIVTVNALPAGTYVINKGDTTNLFYIKTSYGTLSIGEKEFTSKLTLYPNPVIDNLRISSIENIESVSIYSLSGAIVKKVKGNIESVDVSNLSSGSYLVQLVTKYGVITQKIIKK